MVTTTKAKRPTGVISAPKFKKKRPSKECLLKQTVKPKVITSSTDTSNNWTDPVSMTTTGESEALASISINSESCTAVIPVIMSDSETSQRNEEAATTLQLCKEAFIRFSEAFIVMAYCLYLIKEKEWFKLPYYGGYEDYVAFVRDTFKLKKSHLYNYLNIWKRFGELVERNGKPVPQLKTVYRDFKLTQLIALTALSEEQAAKATPDFTVEQIRQLKKKKAVNTATLSNIRTSERHLSAKEAKAFLNSVLNEHKEASFTVTVTWN